MSPATQKALEEFAGKINWGIPGHSSDMERLWNFVISAYRHGEYDISVDEFLAVVDPLTKSPNQSEQFGKKRIGFLMFMYSKYEDGINLLSQFEGK